MKKDIEKIPFEKALGRLEEIVGKMEEGNVPLEQMIRYFEEGNTLATLCGSKLKELEKKIQVLVKEDTKGGEWRDFEDSEEDPIDEDEESEDDLDENDDQETLF